MTTKGWLAVPETLRDSLLNAYESFRALEITGRAGNGDTFASFILNVDRLGRICRFYLLLIMGLRRDPRLSRLAADVRLELPRVPRPHRSTPGSS